MIMNLTAVRGAVLVALMLFAVALAGAAVAGAQGLTSGPGQVLGAASLLGGDPDAGGE